jgi:hypothetical protein
MWPTDRVERPPPTRPSPPCVDMWKPRLRPNRLKTWLARRPAPRPIRPGVWPLGPHVKYTPMVMMILTFGQLHFVIP